MHLNVYPKGFYESLDLFRLKLLPLDAIPWDIVVMGLVVGLSQYFVVVLSLKRGPLAPVSCALSLVFLPVVVYAFVFLNEEISILKLCGTLSGCIAIISASFGKKSKEHSDNSENSISNKIQYLFLLMLIVIIGGLLPIYIKYLSFPLSGKEATSMDLFGNYFFIFLNSAICLTAFIDIFIAKRVKVNWRKIAGPGVLLGCSSICFMVFLSIYVGQFPASIFFPVYTVCGLIVCTLASIAFFKEHFSPALVIMLVFAIGAIIMLT